MRAATESKRVGACRAIDRAKGLGTVQLLFHLTGRFRFFDPWYMTSTEIWKDSVSHHDDDADSLYRTEFSSLLIEFFERTCKLVRIRPRILRFKSAPRYILWASSIQSFGCLRSTDSFTETTRFQASFLRLRWSLNSLNSTVPVGASSLSSN